MTADNEAAEKINPPPPLFNLGRCVTTVAAQEIMEGHGTQPPARAGMQTPLGGDRTRDEANQRKLLAKVEKALIDIQHGDWAMRYRKNDQTMNEEYVYQEIGRPAEAAAAACAELVQICRRATYRAWAEQFNANMLAAAGGLQNETALHLLDLKLDLHQTAEYVALHDPFRDQMDVPASLTISAQVLVSVARFLGGDPWERIQEPM